MNRYSYSSGGSRSPFLRPSILLKLEGYLSSRCNETTAEASMGSCTMAVSFWLTNPPGLSSFSVHCNKSRDFRVFPHVVGAEGPFVLFSASFYGMGYVYFMYRASDSPTLEFIPPPCSKVCEFGILPCSFGCHYRLAALYNETPSDYQLQIYHSETKTWSARTLPNPCLGLKIVPEKVISLGQGSLGWVDLSRGLLVCDLCQEIPFLHFIPLPVLLPENRRRLKTESSDEPGVSARWFRDLTCVNGVLRLIEMEHSFIEAEKNVDPSDTEILLDSDLMMLLRQQDMNEKDKRRDGWRAMIWTRPGSCDRWSKILTVDLDEIFIDERYFLPIKTRLKYMYSSFPTLSPDGDYLYFKIMEEPSDQDLWVGAIDLRTGTLEAVNEYSFEDATPYMEAFRLCTLSDHLVMSPGNECSAFEKITEWESFANGSDNKPVCVDGSIFCEPRGKSQPVRALDEGNHAGNEAEYDDLSLDEAESDDLSCDEAENDGLYWDEAPCGDSHVESTRELGRLLMDTMKHTLNGNPSVVQTDHVPWVHPLKNNLQCFNIFCPVSSDC